MIEDKKKFFTGLGMMAAFVVVLIVFFSPVFGGQNGLDYLDNLYNSISKGSAYYIPQMKGEIETFQGQRFNATLDLGTKTQAQKTALLFNAGGAETSVAAGILQVSGDLNQILANNLQDADNMYHNRSNRITDKYGYNEREVLYNWWMAFVQLEKDLKRQKQFEAAKIVALVKKKAVETSYNYYQIEPTKITDKLWLVAFSLLFYVVYTMWYGFAFMFLFGGWGMKLEH